MYIDGWNMLWSMKRAEIRAYGWCDFWLLAQQQTERSEAEVSVKFFTSYDKPNREKPLKKQEICRLFDGSPDRERIPGNSS